MLDYSTEYGNKRSGKTENMRQQKVSNSNMVHILLQLSSSNNNNSQGNCKSIRADLYHCLTYK